LAFLRPVLAFLDHFANRESSVGTLHSKYTYAEMSSAINDEMTMNRNANTVEGASLKSLVALKVAALLPSPSCPVVLRPGRWAQAKRRPMWPRIYRGA
jgi:hypothetical protein